MSSLDNIIDLPENLEVKRALAVKMILFDFKTEDICALLNVSEAFVSKWKIRFESGAGGTNGQRFLLKTSNNDRLIMAS